MVIDPLGAFIFENNLDLEFFLLQACRIFKDHMNLVTRNPASLKENNKGAGQPALLQSYQHPCF